MPWSHDPTVQSLRLKYNAALAAHHESMRTLNEASMSGSPLSAAAVEKEARARAELERARAQLYDAMAAIVAGPRTDIRHR